MNKVVINEKISVLELWNGISNATNLQELHEAKVHIDFFTSQERRGKPLPPQIQSSNLKDLRGKCYEKEFKLKDAEGHLEIAKLRFGEKLEECKQAIAALDCPTVDDIRFELKKFRDGLKRKKIFVPKETWESYHDLVEELELNLEQEEYAS